MKILAFVDTHGSLKALNTIVKKTKSQNPDLLICAGDLSIFENGLDYLVQRLSRLGKTILFVHGNHETADNFKYVCAHFANVEFIHKRAFRVNNLVFLGYGGGGFAVEDKEFEKTANRLIRTLKKGDNLMLVTHAPPHNTALDKINSSHAGNKSIRKLIEKNNVFLLICGHLHENAGKEDKIGKTRIINPGPLGKILMV